ncbi:cobalt-zinc-cadmium efflux system protein [Hollandina sp. SP2]
MGDNHSHGGHSHSHGSDAKNIGIAFFLNFSFTVLELAGGLFTNGIAIISDAVHDFGDSLSLGLSWYFQRLAKKGSNAKYSYGYKRFSLLGAIINSVVLVVGSIFIVTEAIPRIIAPQETNAKGMFILAIIGIMVNGAAVFRMKKGRSINERVVSLHLLEDVLGWIAVLIASAIIYFFNFTIIDPILSISIAVFVLINVFKNIRQTLRIILQGTPQAIEMDHITERLKEIQNVENVHDLHIWSLDDEYNVLTVHVTLKEALPMSGLAELKNQIRSMLKDEEVRHATIEFETSAEPCDFENCV